MFKKLLFVSVLFFAVETKPFFFGALLKRYSVSLVQRCKAIWHKSMYGSMPAPALEMFEKLQTQALVSKDKVAASLIAFKARIQAMQTKNPFVDSVWYSKFQKTTIRQSQQSSHAAGQAGRAGQAAQEGQAGYAGATFVQNNNTQYVQQTVNRWSIFGGAADAQLARELAEQQSKTKFWKGACLGSVGTAVLLKKFERKKEEKN